MKLHKLGIQFQSQRGNIHNVSFQRWVEAKHFFPPLGKVPYLEMFWSVIDWKLLLCKPFSGSIPAVHSNGTHAVEFPFHLSLT